MPRNFSFWLLVGLVGAVGLLFACVVKPFVIAIFIAVVLAALFAPIHQWITRHVAGHDRIAAGITAVLAIVLVLLPICVTLLMAGTQVMQISNDVVDWFNVQSTDGFDETLEQIEQTKFGGAINRLYLNLPHDQKDQFRQAVAKIADGVTSEFYTKTRGLISDLFTFGVSLCIMALALYYLLADRDVFTRELHRMMPLEGQEEQRLADRFQAVCRGVVLGTVVAGLVQAALAGVGYAVLGIPNFWVLIVATMFFSFIPFVGSAAVWASVTAWLLIEGRYGSGIALAIYGATIVSTSDNLVRAYVIGNQAKLHPLVALVTVLGALRLMGLWGIFVGPMVAAFLYALLNITRERFVNGQERSCP